MLTYITVDISNNMYRGGIEISATKNKDSLGNATAIKISRKAKNKPGWFDVYTQQLETVDDLSFNLFDITTICGITYSYSFDVMAGNGIIESGTIEDVQCWFEGLFVGDFIKQYVAGSNYTTDVKRNREVAYVTTLGSRTPYRVSNGLANYSTGSSSGLFLRLTDDKKGFVPDVDHSFCDEVVEFLSDGNGKVLKTHDGQAWYISIDGAIDIPFNERFGGMNSVSFNWTEIGDIPAFGMVAD